MKHLLQNFRLFKASVEGNQLSVMDDRVFKGMLASDTEDSREALRSLLSACICREVSQVQVIHNDLVPANLEAKMLRIDVHVVFNDGEVANLEMQIGNSGDDLKTRAAVYSAALLVNQTKRGKLYKETKRVYQIFFLNGLLSPASDKLPRRYAYMELEEHDRLTDVTEIIFYELPKLEQRMKAILEGNSDISSLHDDEKWCIFLRYRHDRRAAPLIQELCDKEEGIMRAQRAVNGLTRDQIKFFKNYMKWKDSMDVAQYRADLREAGRAEGAAENSLAIARKLKARGQPLAEIAEITDLPMETIENL